MIKFALTALAIGAALTFAAPDAAHAQKKEATCKVKTGDVGTITGRGLTKDDALEDAATQCFDRRQARYRMRNKGENMDEGTGLTVIDECVNVRCS